jgi:hypothetical protein
LLRVYSLFSQTLKWNFEIEYLKFGFFYS